MLKITGRLAGKSLIRKGVSSWGEWDLIEYIITKQHQKKKIKIIFVAIGRLARVINDMPINERITTWFYPKCREYKGKWYTSLTATEIQKYVNRKKLMERMNGGSAGSPAPDNLTDNQLFNSEPL